MITVSSRTYTRVRVPVVFWIALCAAASPAAGCFDVHAVDPGPYVIDDFDNGTVYPLDPNFGGWQCYSFNPITNMNYSCALSTDTLDGSGYSLEVEFTVDDILNGSQDQGGAGLATYGTVPEDFTRFSQIVFDAELRSGNPTLPSDALLYVQLQCSMAQLEDGSTPGDLYLLQGVPYTTDWSTFILSMTNFAPPPWDSWEIKGGTPGCLSRVDGIQFTVDEQLPDGQSGMGILNVDDIYLQ
jgi:hypothetical protein